MVKLFLTHHKDIDTSACDPFKSEEYFGDTFVPYADLTATSKDFNAKHLNLSAKAGNKFLREFYFLMHIDALIDRVKALYDSGEWTIEQRTKLEVLYSFLGYILRH